jgi:glycosyltransferase involved in cell wall biosynthesis
MSDTVRIESADYSSVVPIVPTRSDVGNINVPPKPLAHAKVLHIINGEFFSGAERVQQGLGKRLQEFGFQADFACLKTGKFLEACDLPPNRVFEFPMNSRRDFSVVPRLTQFILDGHYQVVHAHTPRSAMVTAMIAKRTATPWVYHVHSPTSRDSTRLWLNCLNAWTERLALFSCHQLITVSDSLNAEMRRKGWEPHRVTTIHNGVEQLPAIDWSNRLPTNPWRLGMVALMRPRKGVEVLLEALYILSARRKDIHLEFVGSFETLHYQEQIEKLVRRCVTVETEKWEQFDNGDIRIQQVIHIERENQKSIILGKNGERLREIGTKARLELEKMLGSKVHLKLFVRVSQRWRDDPDYYQQWGLDYKA